MRNPRWSSVSPVSNWWSQELNPAHRSGLITSSLPQLTALSVKISRNSLQVKQITSADWFWPVSCAFATLSIPIPSFLRQASFSLQERRHWLINDRCWERTQPWPTPSCPEGSPTPHPMASHPSGQKWAQEAVKLICACSVVSDSVAHRL